jgi:hypothetical protein
MKHNALVFISLMLVLASCGQKKTEKNAVESVKMEAHRVLDEFEISTPDYMLPMDGLNDRASLELGNEEQEIYCIVINESKAEFFEVFDQYQLSDFYTRDLRGFTQMLLETMEEDSGISNLGDLKPIEINGLNALKTSFTNQFNGLDIFYTYVNVESEDNFYQIMIWTLEANQEKYYPLMNKIALSFKRL